MHAERVQVLDQLGSGKTAGVDVAAYVGVDIPHLDTLEALAVGLEGGGLQPQPLSTIGGHGRFQRLTLEITRLTSRIAAGVFVRFSHPCTVARFPACDTRRVVGGLQQPITVNPMARVAVPRARSWVAITSSSPAASHQRRAVAK